MKFHNVHGNNIILNDTGQRASRTTSFCDGITFSDSPIKTNTIIPLRIYSPANEWLGYLFIGMTTRDPNTFSENNLPKHSLSLFNEEDIWIKQIFSQWANSLITLQLTKNGSLDIGINGGSRKPFIIGLPLDNPLWLIVDLHGATTCVQYATYHQSNPSEFLVLGPDVNSALKCGANGIVPYNSVRTMLLGPFNSGKSTLKQALVNQNSEDSISRIGLEKSKISASNVEWIKLNFPNNPSDNSMNDMSEKEMYKILAHNIVREIKINDEEKLENMTASCSNEIIKSKLRIFKKSYSKEVKQISMKENSEMLTEMVEALMKKQSQIDNEKINHEISKENPVKYEINIWDFCGFTIYFLLHQILLTSNAIYILVIDINNDLDAPIELDPSDSTVLELHKKDLTSLSLIHHWLSVIHSLTGSNYFNEKDSQKDLDDLKLLPQIILVGTHRNSVHQEPITRDQIIKETFDKIYSSLENKPYAHHLHPNYFALDFKEMSFDEPKLIKELRMLIQTMIEQQKLAGFDIPIPWQEFKQIIERLKQRNIYFADFNQLHEVISSKIDGLSSFESFNGVLNFYHNNGLIFCIDHISTFPSSTNQMNESGIIILDPCWFINCAYKLCKSIKYPVKEDMEAAHCGILNEQILNYVWSECIEQKLLLLGCLEKLDLICELKPYVSLEEAPDVAATTLISKTYFFPWISQMIPENDNYLDAIQDSALKIAIEFETLPVGLFSRLLVRLSRWSWNQGWGRRPEMYNSEGRIAVDFDHDLILKICLKYNRITLMIIKIFEGIQSEQSELFYGPTPNVCVKVQHLIESELETLKNVFYRRTVFKLVVQCPCKGNCEIHKVEGCLEEECSHFLPLNECLSKKVVECKLTCLVRTIFIQKYFPQASFNQSILEDQVYYNNLHEGSSWDHIFQIEPSWMRQAAKLLENKQNRDWIALAKRLGYCDKDISKLIEDATPSLTLLKNWYETNGRTRYCIDVLISCLRMILREDVINIIEYELEPEVMSPPIFISYHWDSQEQVFELRRKLELSGFPCWMDVNFMGGGDLLYGKIYDGISRAKVIMCCLTPKYVASPMCAREATLADVLHKPIIPVMLEQTPWPPPGPMAVIMSPIIYIDFCGVGGHAGIGKSGDSESRFRDLLDKVSRHLSGSYMDPPMIPHSYLQMPDVFSPIYDMLDGEQQKKEFDSMTNHDTSSLEQETNGESQENNNATIQNEITDVIRRETNSADNLSMISNQRHNVVTNCSICAIL